MKITEEQKLKREIKKDITSILENHLKPLSCLCGHRESCENCTKSPKHERLVKELREYLSKM